MAKPLSEIRDMMRIALGDDIAALASSYTDAQIDSIITSTVKMGLGPKCVGLNDDEDCLDPEPPNYDTLGYLILQAAFHVIGSDTPVNVKSRAMTVSVNPQHRKLTLDTIRTQIHRLQSKGNLCGNKGSASMVVTTDCHTYLCSAFSHGDHSGQDSYPHCDSHA